MPYRADGVAPVGGVAVRPTPSMLTIDTDTFVVAIIWLVIDNCGFNMFLESRSTAQPF